MKVGELKKYLEEFSDEDTVVIPCIYSEGLKEANKPVKRLVIGKEDKYIPLYSTQEHLKEKEVVVIY